MILGIELFRGIAALMVLMTHYARFITPGETGLAFLWTGVDLFFVISGFVFAPMVLDRDGPALAVKPYLVRRFFRIYPLYAVAVLAYYFVTPETADKTLYLIRHLAFLHTTSSITEAYFFNPAFWSLPVEVEFYLVLPLLAWLVGSPRKLAGLFAAALLATLLLYMNRGPQTGLLFILSVHLCGILPEFLVGTFLYHFVRRGCPLLPALAVAGAGAALLLFEYHARFGALAPMGVTALYATFNLGCALAYGMLMFPLLLLSNQRYAPAMQRTAVFCGSISYGVYLFHNLVPRLLTAAGLQAQGWSFLLLSTALTVLLALAGYHFIENPARLFGRRLSRRLLHGRGIERVSPEARTQS